MLHSTASKQASINNKKWLDETAAAPCSEDTMVYKEMHTAVLYILCTVQPTMMPTRDVTHAQHTVHQHGCRMDHRPQLEL